MRCKESLTRPPYKTHINLCDKYRKATVQSVEMKQLGRFGVLALAVVTQGPKLNGRGAIIINEAIKPIPCIEGYRLIHL